MVYKGGDTSDGLANAKWIVDFFHMPSGTSVDFKAFITEFSDSFTSEYDEAVYTQQMDMTRIFKHTTRNITLGWDVPAGSEKEARLNLKKASTLIRMLYPAIREQQGDRWVGTGDGPVFKVRFANLIGKPGTAFGSAKETGLRGYLKGISFNPEIENQGFFIDNEKMILYPKLLKFSCTFSPQHELDPGWVYGEDQNIKFNHDQFPYPDASITTREDKATVNVPVALMSTIENEDLAPQEVLAVHEAIHDQIMNSGD